MVCVGPSLPVFVIFVASVVDGGTAIVLDGPSGLLPAMWSQRVYAPMTHLAGLDFALLRISLLRGYDFENLFL